MPTVSSSRGRVRVSRQQSHNPSAESDAVQLQAAISAFAHRWPGGTCTKPRTRRAYPTAVPQVRQRLFSKNNKAPQ
jgi:hypothetical protein